MAFRVVWPSRVGEERSQSIEGFEAARLIADALNSYLKVVHVIDAETKEIVYSRRRTPETRFRSVLHRLRMRGSFLHKLNYHTHSS